MITIQKHGIILQTLSVEDIEFLRELRNSPADATFYFNKKYITKEQQLVWFNSLNPDTYFGMIAKVNGRRIAYYSINDIDTKKATAENFTIMCLHKNSKNNPISTSIFTNFIFKHFELKKVFGRIKPENSPSINYAQKIGFKMVSDEAELYYLTKENFENSAVERVVHKIAQLELT